MTTKMQHDCEPKAKCNKLKVHDRTEVHSWSDYLGDRRRRALIEKKELG